MRRIGKAATSKVAVRKGLGVRVPLPPLRLIKDIIVYMDNFEHEALKLKKDKPLIYTAMSKHLFYYRMHISKYVIERNKIPLNPFMIFDYFLLDSVDRNLIREGNNTLVNKSDELWVFGPISNGVLAEIKIAKEMNKPIKYFKIEKPHKIVSVSKKEVEMEEDVKDFKSEL